MRKKIAIVGAGNIGGVLGLLCVMRDLGNVTLIDVNEGQAIGKSLDLSQTAALLGVGASVVGTSNIEQGIAGADVIVVTAGVPRQPGMSRDDLLIINAEIIKGIAHKIRDHAPEAFVIVVTNPLDAMAWLLQRESRLPAPMVVGMAGILDSARFRYFLSEEFDVSAEDIRVMVLGGHGDTMVPLVNYSSVGAMSIQHLLRDGWLKQDRFDAMVDRTRYGGAEIVNHLKTGSAFFTPAASAFEMVESYLLDKRRIFPCSAYVQGQYNLRGIYIGVPVVIGAEGVEEIIESPLMECELSAMRDSAKAIRELIEPLEKTLESV